MNAVALTIKCILSHRLLFPLLSFVAVARLAASPPSFGTETTVSVAEVPLILRWIPAGNFLMGGGKALPVTPVRISRGFWLGKYDVTQIQWWGFMARNPSIYEGAPDTTPIDSMTWIEAMTFCQRLTAQERGAGRLPDGYQYRLPTEAEWEYACRAGTTGDYGKSEKLDRVGWFVRNSAGHPHPVGQKVPNAWGLYDVHGDVFQWCYDWSAPYSGIAMVDPTGPATGVTRIMRGGSFYSEAADCAASARSSYLPDNAVRATGFRVALGPAIENAWASIDSARDAIIAATQRAHRPLLVVIKAANYVTGPSNPSLRRLMPHRIDLSRPEASSPLVADYLPVDNRLTSADGQRPPPWLVRKMAGYFARQGFRLAESKKPELALVFEWGHLNPQINHISEPAQVIDLDGDLNGLTAGDARLDERIPFLVVRAYEYAALQEKPPRQVFVWQQSWSTVYVTTGNVEVGKPTMLFGR